MKTIKEAADSLLSKSEITQDEYNEIEKSGTFIEKNAVKGMRQLKNFLNVFKGPSDPKLGVVKNVGRSIKDVNIFNALKVIAIGGAAGVAGKELAIDPFLDKRKINKSFEAMSSKVPQLQGKDPEQVKDYFNVVRTFSPKAASNPLVAGALVNKMMEFGGVDHKLVQDIAAIQAGVSSPGIARTGLEGAVKTIAGAKPIEV